MAPEEGTRRPEEALLQLLLRPSANSPHPSFLGKSWDEIFLLPHEHVVGMNYDEVCCSLMEKAADL